METVTAHPKRPTIHFDGEVEGQARILMSGWVAVTPDNCVRWHFVSTLREDDDFMLT